MREDPNKVRNDPMVPEYWLAGEDLQDKIRAAGYDSPTVDGIAVDIHDLLQAAKRIEEEIVPMLADAGLADREKFLQLLQELRYEFDHIAWHSASGTHYLDAAINSIER